MSTALARKQGKADYITRWKYLYQRAREERRREEGRKKDERRTEGGLVRGRNVTK